MEIEKLKVVAEEILMSQVEDLEFLSVWEMLWTALEDDEEFKALSYEDRHALALKVDKMCRKAFISIEVRDVE